MGDGRDRPQSLAPSELDAIERVAARHPIVAVCGFSGAGKTTLLEALVPRLTALGLSVAVIKHDAHGIDIDRPGKDSDRLFRAGATVMLRGPNETVLRAHPESRDQHGSAFLAEALLLLASQHDLVLVEGHKSTPLPKIWLLRDSDPGSSVQPPDHPRALAVLDRHEDRLERSLGLVSAVLGQRWSDRQVLGAVLVGGRSRRMGRPKQLVDIDGLTMAERVAASIEPHVDQVVTVGSGRLPEGLERLPRLIDAPGVNGPLAGMLAASRWAPDAAWLIAACDQPLISGDAVAWLLSCRAPGRWAILPTVPGLEGTAAQSSGSGQSQPAHQGERIAAAQPMLALYEPQARHLLEELGRASSAGPIQIVDHPKVASPRVPGQLRASWTSIDDPTALATLGLEPDQAPAGGTAEAPSNGDTRA